MANKTNNRGTPPTTNPAAPRTTTPASVADRGSLASTRAPHRPAPSEEQIRSRAYYLWIQAGQPEGDGVQFWLEAERELNTPK